MLSLHRNSAGVAKLEDAPASGAGGLDRSWRFKSSRLHECGCGEIGRRTSLRGWWPQNHVGSSPTVRTFAIVNFKFKIYNLTSGKYTVMDTGVTVNHAGESPEQVRFLSCPPA